MGREAKPRNWMPIYWGDYLRDTSHLSAAEHGAYLLLIAHYWHTGRPIPDEDALLQRLSRMSANEWQKSKPIILEFFEIKKSKWYHWRIEDELKRWTDKTLARIEAGKKGAEQRWQTHSKGMANACDSDGKGNGKTMPSTSTSTPVFVSGKDSKSIVHPEAARPTESGSSPKPKYPPEFEAFWSAYPLKKGKGTAVKAWEKAVKGGVTNETLIGAVGVALEKDQQWIRDGGKYIPHPSTWLNSSGWEDEHESEVSRKPRWVQRLEAGEFDSSRRNGRHHADA